MNNLFPASFFILALFVGGCSEPQRHPNEEATFHIHADFKVYINGEAVDFSLPAYQLRDKYVHVEDGVGELIHVHKKGATIGYFFETLDIEFNDTCFVTPAEGAHCNEGNKRLRFYVNGIENNEFGNYEIQNSDKILISFGDGDIDKQLGSVTGLAEKING